MTQVEKLRAAFEAGQAHTVYSSTVELGITALHQRVADLRETRYPVKREEVLHNGRYLARFSKG